MKQSADQARERGRLLRCWPVAGFLRRPRKRSRPRAASATTRRSASLRPRRSRGRHSGSPQARAASMAARRASPPRRQAACSRASCARRCPGPGAGSLPMDAPLRPACQWRSGAGTAGGGSFTSSGGKEAPAGLSAGSPPAAVGPSAGGASAAGGSGTAPSTAGGAGASSMAVRRTTGAVCCCRRLRSRGNRRRSRRMPPPIRMTAIPALSVGFMAPPWTGPGLGTPANHTGRLLKSH